VIIFESPVRLTRLLADLADACGAERRVAVARELTKLHEQVFRGTLEEALAYYDETPAKGEVTLVVEGVSSAEQPALDEDDVREVARDLLDSGMRPSGVARELARRLDVGKNDAYRIVHEMAPESTAE
jgi:16S rRNA (cytidine1402-2'-O)-methyltransferase